jgi:Abortive infection alpha
VDEQVDPGTNGSEARESYGDAVMRAAPGLARIYASIWWHTAEWTVNSSLRAGSRMLRTAIGGGSAADLVQTAEDEVREYARRLLRRDGDEEPDLYRAHQRQRSRPADEPSTTDLRERGAELLRRSADVHYDEDVHPAYARILDALAPDEARILRLLATKGPQPSVDVRAGLPLVSELVAPGRSMIGAEAGCRFPERVHAYLNNLYRLGLIWFSREPIRERLRYQVLEAQPEVIAALRKGGRTARTVRRSILLTPFGRDFCDVCLPLDTAEFESLAPEPAEGGEGGASEPDPTRPAGRGRPRS